VVYKVCKMYLKNPTSADDHKSYFYHFCGSSIKKVETSIKKSRTKLQEFNLFRTAYWVKNSGNLANFWKSWQDWDKKLGNFIYFQKMWVLHPSFALYTDPLT